MKCSLIVVIASATQILAATLPTVDLGYAIYQPTINVCILGSLGSKESVALWAAS